ncbi:MAG TPA: hypothetical protein VM511_01095, partial [Luteolibacter sp.]|nr:hypothetical protein [Luteolibacter sp.]
MKSLLPILSLCGSANLFAASVTLPFSTNFDTYTAGTDVSALFAENNSGTANSSFVDLGSGDIAMRQTISGTGTSNSSASVTSA